MSDYCMPAGQGVMREPHIHFHAAQDSLRYDPEAHQWMPSDSGCDYGVRCREIGYSEFISGRKLKIR
eukprot:1362640-Amorphochlora_amoeboformis.AAC.1